jgi:thiosulfate reductase cytochrome b subunit
MHHVSRPTAACLAEQQKLAFSGLSSLLYCGVLLWDMLMILLFGLCMLQKQQTPSGSGVRRPKVPHRLSAALLSLLTCQHQDMKRALLQTGIC